jgi:membrane protein CcdC involved in cytochrome C biogenesis
LRRSRRAIHSLVAGTKRSELKEIVKVMNEGQIFVIVAVLVLMIARRFAGSPVTVKSWVLPLALMVGGAFQIHGHLGFKDLALLATEMVISVGAGVLRGQTIKLFMKDGQLWQRYTPLTLLVWIAMIVIRVAFGALGHAWGATISAEAVVLIAFGLSLFIESLVVNRRAVATGAPVLLRASRRERRFVDAR